MNISMSNVGALPDITIRADGITVLYGPNDTGKSTVLKAIDSVLVHSDSDETYAHLVEKRIESTFDGHETVQEHPFRRPGGDLHR